MSPSKSAGWQLSSTHLALLTSFVTPHPLDHLPVSVDWSARLGEPSELALEHFKQENLIERCEPDEMVQLGLLYLSQEQIDDLLRNCDLPLDGGYVEHLQRLLASQSPLLQAVVPDVWKLTAKGEVLVQPGLKRAVRRLAEMKLNVGDTEIQVVQWLKKSLVWLALLIGEGAAFDLLKEKLYPFMSDELSALWKDLIKFSPVEAAPLPVPQPSDLFTSPTSQDVEAATPVPKLTGLFIEPKLVRIPAGPFWMGSYKLRDKDAYNDELPQHKLDLPEFWMGKYPVTNHQYQAFVIAASHPAPSHWKGSEIPAGKENHPVVNVTWNDSAAFCSWLSKASGRSFRLPSEAEWEKAARGEDGRIYPWGDAWDTKKCNSTEGGPGTTTPVGQYSSQGDSPYGCADMAGNVWEWTSSLDEKYPYQPGSQREGLEKTGYRVLRGGSFDIYRRLARSAVRGKNLPHFRVDSIGFRVVVSPGNP